MYKIQKRIGLLFFILSLSIYVMKIFFAITNNKPISILLEFDRLSYLIYSAIFLFTYYYTFNWLKYVQVIILLYESYAILSVSKDDLFFGLSLIIIVVLLLYVYDFFNKNKILKIVLCNIGLFGLFYLSTSIITKYPIFNSLLWLIFVNGLVFFFWFIFKDSINRIEEKEIHERDKLIKLLEETRDIAHDAIKAYEKYFEKHKDLS